MRRSLRLHEWGEPGQPRVVFLHGVASHGAHARELAEGWLEDRYHVLAPDLLGHGSSPYEPPWDLDAHLRAITDAVGDAPAAWIGHSFGGRLAFELAARHPERVDRLVLLDPAIWVPPDHALVAAENARRERTYVSFEEGIDRRYEESQLSSAPRELLEAELQEHLVSDDEGRWRYRYCQACVVSAYGTMAGAPPPFDSVRLPTLLLLGERSYLPYDALLPAHAAALGDLLQVVTVPGGHTVLWDALEPTADAIAGFLSAPAG